MSRPLPPTRWLRADGTVVACTESVKVLEENWREAVELLEEQFEDAVLLGVGKDAFRAAMHALVDQLECEYAEKTGADGARGAGEN